MDPPRGDRSDPGLTHGPVDAQHPETGARAVGMSCESEHQTSPRGPARGLSGMVVSGVRLPAGWPAGFPQRRSLQRTRGRRRGLLAPSFGCHRPPDLRGGDRDRQLRLWESVASRPRVASMPRNTVGHLYTLDSI